MHTSYFMPPAYFYNKYIPDLCPADQRARLMNMRGLQWCLSQKGRLVGRGYSEDLVNMHLANSAAVPGDFRNHRNYVWGAIPSGWGPGDVLQFEGCRFEWTEGSTRYLSVFEHHSAVIASLSNSVAELVHQDFNGGKTVVVTKLNLNAKRMGTIRGWRPVGSY